MSEAPAATPRPLGAVALTLFAWTVLVLVALLAEPAGSTASLALGLAAGFGGIGTLAARAIPPPAERRIGLVGFPPRLLVPLLLLIPAVLLVSELDNQLAVRLFDGVELKREAGPSALELLELVLLLVLLRPVLEEFFFRGVVQQGLVAALGARGGVALTAVLFALVRASYQLTDAYQATSLGLQAFVVGVLLGCVRLATGSLLACLLLSCALAGTGFLGEALRETWVIPGFNGPGRATPAAWLAGSALAVAAGLWLLARHAERERGEGE